MVAEAHVNVGGAWRKIPTNGIYVNAGSAWQQVNYAYTNVGGGWQTTYIRDSTGPSAPTGAYARWYTTSGTPGGTPSLYIAWTNPPEPDYAYMYVTVVINGTPYFAGTYNNTIQGFHYPYVVNNVIYPVYLTPYDGNGNAGPTVYLESQAWTGTARGRTPNPVQFDAIDSGTFRPEYFGWVGGLAMYRVKWGNAESPAFIQQHGCYIYGQQIRQKLSGAVIGSGTVDLFRVNSGHGPPGPQYAWMYRASGLNSKAQSPQGFGQEPYEINGLAVDGVNTPWTQQWIHPNWFPYVSSGNPASALSALIFYRPDPGMGADMFGYGDAPGTVVPGRLTFYHCG